METMKVVYVPVVTVDGKTAYHGTVVYTNSQGQTFFAAGDIGNSSLTKEQRSNIGNAILGEFAAANGTGYDPYGELVTVQGSTSDPAMAAYVEKWITNAVGYSNSVEAYDLSGYWNVVSSAMTQINNDHLYYAPATQNSNSAMCTSLIAAKLDTMLDISNTNSLGGQAFAPGCFNVLPTSFTPSTSTSDPYQIFTDYDEYGNPTVTVSAVDPSGTDTEEDTTYDLSSKTLTWDGLSAFGSRSHYEGFVGYIAPSDPDPYGMQDWDDGNDPTGGYGGGGGGYGDGGGEYGGGDGGGGGGGGDGGGGDGGGGGGGGNQPEYPVDEYLTHVPSGGVLGSTSDIGDVSNTPSSTRSLPYASATDAVNPPSSVSTNALPVQHFVARRITEDTPYNGLSEISRPNAAVSASVNSLIQAINSFVPPSMSSPILSSNDTVMSNQMSLARPFMNNFHAQFAA